MKRSAFAGSCMLLIMTAGAVGQAYNPFASEVIDISLNGTAAPSYLPAPGQRVNLPLFNNASRALGAVSGGGTAAANNDSVVTLGGFGGQIVLGFSQDVRDNPANPMGLDAIVFSNSFFAYGSEQLHWAELGTIEIMPELNGNGIAGDAPGEQWYLIRGSHLGAGSYREQTWDRTAGPQPDGTYPIAAGWPDSYTTGAHELHPAYQTGLYEGSLANPNVLDQDPGNDQIEGYWGYAGYAPALKLGDRDGDNSTAGPGDFATMSPELFYTTPDDPLSVGISPGSGGGDAFDIAWAIDPDTWQPAGLEAFRYLRITTAVDAFLGYEGELGEVSVEVDGVAAVRATCDLDGDGVSGLGDYDAMRACQGLAWNEAGFLPTADIVVDSVVDESDWATFFSVWTQVNIAGDGNLDGLVSGADYVLWANHFALTGASWGQGDFNGDGAVTGADYVVWANNFGAGAAAGVPEPATAAMLVIGAIALARRPVGRGRKG